jgi:threonine/homoserine/homoserine lactone efflux protein
LVAAFGLTAVAGALASHSYLIKIIGGLFLCYLGIAAFRSRPAAVAPKSGNGSLLLSFGTTFLLTIANPMTVLSFLAVFAGLDVASAKAGYGDSALLVAGVFTGSAVWWFLLSGAASLLRHRFTPAAMLWVNRSSGLLVFGFGIAALVHK